MFHHVLIVIKVWWWRIVSSKRQFDKGFISYPPKSNWITLPVIIIIHRTLCNYILRCMCTFLQTSLGATFEIFFVRPDFHSLENFDCIDGREREKERSEEEEANTAYINGSHAGSCRIHSQWLWSWFPRVDHPCLSCSEGGGGKERARERERERYR